ncbi:MAG TPA: hypothetical protein DDW52_09415 [Planctomycetaceae bacterium]|nr:hypothetical protein [Planctomycetaceae bacterium]
MRRGVGGEPLVGIVSQAGHYSNATLAGWLGIGLDNLHAVETDASMAMRLDRLEEKLESLYREGKKIAFVIATFGTTDAFGIDDIAAIREIIDRKSAEHNAICPHLHVDAAVGWVGCFLTEYDTKTNPLEIDAPTLPLVERTQAATVGFRVADSVTIDFHKMGWGHYPSSAFIVNRREDLNLLSRSVDDAPYFAEADIRHDPALFTLECSRPGIGPYSVMASLNGIGLSGYRMLVANAMERARQLKEKIEQLEYCKVLNFENPGPSVCWWVLPRGRDAKAIYDRIVAGDLPEEEIKQYQGEIRRLFIKRETSMNPARDARLSFTMNVGFSPGGVALPAWKAVFFHPQSDEEVIDRIMESIEDVA